MQPLPNPFHQINWPSGWEVFTPPYTRNKLPKLTVITPSFNQGKYIEATLRSVLSQNYPHLEYIVVDGGSTDGSAEIIRHYADHLAYWVSEKDRGQTDAIQKALDRATGEWCVWINSDDLLAPGALWRIASNCSDTDVIAGGVLNFIDRRVTRAVTNKRLTVPAMIFQHLNGGSRFHQPGIWLRTEALKAIGLSRERHYKFDYEMLLRYLRRFPRTRYLPDTLAYFRLHEHSKTVSQSSGRGNAFHREHIAILSELSRDPDFTEYRTELELAGRQCEWIESLARYNEPGSRWPRLANLWQEVRVDPSARCIGPTRKTAMRIARSGLWPKSTSGQIR